MRLPKTVEIGPSRYSIEHTKNLGSRGLFNSHKGIKIIKGMPSDMTAEVLLHEIIHAVYYTFSIGPLVEEGDKKDTQEILVTLMSTGLATVMRQNPKLFKDMLEALK